MISIYNFYFPVFALGCLYAPLCSSIICGFFGNYLGTTYSKIFSVGCLFFTFFSSCIILLSTGIYEHFGSLKLFTCFDISLVQSVLENGPIDSDWLYYVAPAPGRYSVIWGLYFDAVTGIILFVISSISLVVHIYAISYISHDPHQPRFFANLSLFTFFIIVLVTADNYFQLFVGWEGVGVCSYLLIGFWYTRIQANKSALQALVINKVGDLALLLAIITLFLFQGSTSFNVTINISVWFQSFEILIGFYAISLGNFIGFLFFIGAIAKSAQIGLHTWLLSAIEGPTPVSALLHAATIVTAGIFLIIRSSYFWQQTPDILFLITLCGALTAFFAATCGLVQHDIKKIIAFSTCSQLGYMFYACGLGEYTSSLYHLTNHAFFKALLFLGAGAVIHALHGEQDLRKMGGLAQVIPITYIAIIIASLSLLGFPFLSGFYSKDILIELAWVHYTVPSIFAFWLATLSAFLTAFYSMRLLYFVFLSNPNLHKTTSNVVLEADRVILISFRPLIFGSIFSGYLFHDAFIGGGRFFINDLTVDLLEINQSSSYIEAEFLPSYIKLIPVIFSFLGIFLALFLYSNHTTLLILIKFQITNSIIQKIHFLFIKKWYFDIIYNNYLAISIYRFGIFCYKYGDQGILEWLGPQGIYYILSNISPIRQSTAKIHLELLLQGISVLVFFIWFLI